MFLKTINLDTNCGMCVSVCPFSQDLDTIENTTTFKYNEKLILEALEEYTVKYKKRLLVRDNSDLLG